MASQVDFRLPFGWFEPPETATGNIVFAFDRDRTVDVNPPRDHSGVPLEWVRRLAHETNHVVFATGNQKLKQEAEIPGTVESVAISPTLSTEDIYEGQNTPGHPLPRVERVRILQEAYPEAADYIVVDDKDLSQTILPQQGWRYFSPSQFTHAIESEAVPIDSDLPS